MRHRVFEDDEDYDIDKYDIQVCVFTYGHNYGIIVPYTDIAFFNIKNSVKNGNFSVGNYLDLGLVQETMVI